MPDENVISEVLETVEIGVELEQIAEDEGPGCVIAAMVVTLVILGLVFLHWWYS